MPFQKGNKYGKGGARDMRGKGMTKAKREASSLAQRLAFDMAREFLEQSFKPIMLSYIGLATGGKAGRKVRLDPATCRHAVERALGQAPRIINLDLQDSVESFLDKVMKHGAIDNAIDVGAYEDAVTKDDEEKEPS